MAAYAGGDSAGKEINNQETRQQRESDQGEGVAQRTADRNGTRAAEFAAGAEQKMTVMQRVHFHASLEARAAVGSYENTIIIYG